MLFVDRKLGIVSGDRPALHVGGIGFCVWVVLASICRAESGENNRGSSCVCKKLKMVVDLNES